jgi:hypothetical protein
MLAEEDESNDRFNDSAQREAAFVGEEAAARSSLDADLVLNIGVLIFLFDFPLLLKNLLLLLAIEDDEGVALKFLSRVAYFFFFLVDLLPGVFANFMVDDMVLGLASGVCVRART